MINFNKTELKNKLEVYHFPINEGSGVINVDIFYKVGSRDEVMGKSGIAHMLEHLNFKSSKNLNAGEFDKIVTNFGGLNNASTGFDYTHYYIKCSKENLSKSLELFAELMQNLNLKNEEFIPEREVVAEERRWRTDNNPMGYLFYRLYNHAFIYHPYHWTPIGFSEDIKNWTIEDIREFHSKFYQPQNAFIIVSGDIEKNEVFNLSKKYFENIENKCEIKRTHCIEPIQDGPKRAKILRDTQSAILALAYKIPPFNHNDQPFLQALAAYLNNGKSSPLQEILIDKLGLANRAYAYNMDSIDENLFIFLVNANEKINCEDIEKELLKIIENLKTRLLDKDESEGIFNAIKSDFIYSFESASKISDLYGSYIARGDINAISKFKNSIYNLKSEDIQRVARKYFNEQNSTTLILQKD